MNQSMFLIAKDRKTAESLQNAGYKLLKKTEDGITWFHNDSQLNFSALNINENNIAFTNILSM